MLALLLLLALVRGNQVVARDHDCSGTLDTGVRDFSIPFVGTISYQLVVNTPSCAFQAQLFVGGFQVWSTVLDPANPDGDCADISAGIITGACLKLVDVVVAPNATASGSFSLELKTAVGTKYQLPPLLEFSNNPCVASCFVPCNSQEGDPTCYNHGYCELGGCQCLPGWKGSYCQIAETAAPSYYCFDISINPTGPTTLSPTLAPTDAPTSAPTNSPTTGPPTDAPTISPTTNAPTEAPTEAPTTVARRGLFGFNTRPCVSLKFNPCDVTWAVYFDATKPTTSGVVELSEVPSTISQKSTITLSSVETLGCTLALKLTNLIYILSGVDGYLSGNVQASVSCPPLQDAVAKVPFSQVSVPGDKCASPLSCLFGVWNASSKMCDCFNGYNGTLCDCQKCPGGCPFPVLCNFTCSGHGVCSPTGACQCDGSWSGNACQYESSNRAVALGVGIGLGLFVLIVIVILIVWWVKKGRVPSPSGPKPPKGALVLKEDDGAGAAVDMENLDLE